MSKLQIVILMALSTNLAAGTIETNICFHNYTDKKHTLKVADIENYDWGSKVHRPDKNLHNVTIKPNETICKREDVNSWSRDP